MRTFVPRCVIRRHPTCTYLSRNRGLAGFHGRGNVSTLTQQCQGRACSATHDAPLRWCRTVQQLDLLALQSAALHDVRRAWLALITQLPRPPPPPGIPSGQRPCATMSALPRKLRQSVFGQSCVYVGTTTSGIGKTPEITRTV